MGDRYVIRFYDSIGSEDWSVGQYWYNRDEDQFYGDINEATEYPTREAAEADLEKARRLSDGFELVIDRL